MCSKHTVGQPGCIVLFFEDLAEGPAMRRKADFCLLVFSLRTSFARSHLLDGLYLLSCQYLHFDLLLSSEGRPTPSD